MKGDFTRLTHDPLKGYSAVLKQQGRLDLDADWNEQVAIQDHRLWSLIRDVVGSSGAPHAGGGFQVGVTGDGSDLTLASGRIWVDGILCELAEEATYSQQPHLPIPPPLLAGDGDGDGDEDVEGRRDLVYLDVWERHVSAVEDPTLLDPALNGLDTTTRLQTVFQVRVLKDVGDAGCDGGPAFPPPAGAGRLSTGGVAVPDPEDPCGVVATGGYRGVENRLYRVEIHDPGGVGEATWKWSRDNGSVLFPVEEFPVAPANRIRLQGLGRDAMVTLRQDDWIEVLDDASELGLEPGFMARVQEVNPATQVLTLDRDLPDGRFQVARNARVRRWDQVQEVAGDTGVRPTAAGPLELEDGVQVRFGGHDFRSGDYWVFAARTSGGTVEVLEEAPPRGVRHRYAPLARIRWEDTGDGTLGATILEDCRPGFPPLTGIGADDVGYDNAHCDLPGATTVQEALDQLCRSRDLRFHNRHLHGWGIVCGLKVVCGPGSEDRRRRVTVRTGYAIDPMGNDLLVEEEIGVDLLGRIGELDEANPDAPILDGNGDGEVCLVLERNGNGPAVRVEPLGAPSTFWQRVLAGTMLKDFYDRCIRRVLEFVRGEFTADPDEEEGTGGEGEAMPVGPTRRRLTTFMNLLVQFVNPANGRYVYLSSREDTILRDFYERLRALLRSETFCAMFEGARPFPDYPFPQADANTVFGKGFHTRLRVDPTGARGYTVGAGSTLHVYDLEQEEMVSEVEFPGGSGVQVRDVAFSADGRRLYGIGTLGDDTLFAVATVDGDGLRFRPASILCGVELVTLATAPNRSQVYAIGLGTGLYELNPDAVPEQPQPMFPFNAVGHLEIPTGGAAYATAGASELDGGAQGGATGVYDRVFRLPLAGGDPVGYRLQDPQGGPPLQGRDGLAVRFSPQGRENHLYVVAEAGEEKRILVFDAGHAGPQPRALASIPVENTGIRMATLPETVVVSFADSYRLGLLDPRSHAMVTLPGTQVLYRHPVQIAPGAMAVSPTRERLYVLNFMSNTLTRVGFSHLRPEGQLDLDALVAYRQGVIEAFLDLAGGFLQYLKDCFCDHFLVDCPEFDEEDRIYLACASVRGGQVYQVCNFSRRKYVKSFPTVDYWLSLVPVLPLLRETVAKACCAILPDLFRRVRVPGRMEATAAAAGGGSERTRMQEGAQVEPRMKAVQMERAVMFTQGLDLSGILETLGGRVDVAKGFAGDWFSSPVPGVPARQQRQKAPEPGQVVGQRVEVAQGELQAAGIEVAAVREYDPARGAENLLSFARIGGRVPTGQPLTLYQSEGVVRYYSVAEREPGRDAEAGRERDVEAGPRPAPTGEPRTPAPVERELDQTREALEETRSEVASLREEMERIRRESAEAVAVRDQELAELRTATETMREEVRSIDALRVDMDRLLRRDPPRE